MIQQSVLQTLSGKTALTPQGETPAKGAETGADAQGFAAIMLAQQDLEGELLGAPTTMDGLGLPEAGKDLPVGGKVLPDAALASAADDAEATPPTGLAALAKLPQTLAYRDMPLLPTEAPAATPPQSQATTAPAMPASPASTAPTLDKLVQDAPRDSKTIARMRESMPQSQGLHAGDLQRIFTKAPALSAAIEQHAAKSQIAEQKPQEKPSASTSPVGHSLLNAYGKRAEKAASQLSAISSTSSPKATIARTTAAPVGAPGSNSAQAQAPVTPPAPESIKAFVERLVQTRESALSPSGRLSLVNGDLGSVSLRFDNIAAGLSASVSAALASAPASASTQAPDSLSTQKSIEAFVERLVQIRESAPTAAGRLSIANDDFGTVSLRNDNGAAGISATLGVAPASAPTSAPSQAQAQAPVTPPALESIKASFGRLVLTRESAPSSNGHLSVASNDPGTVRFENTAAGLSASVSAAPASAPASVPTQASASLPTSQSIEALVERLVQTRESAQSSSGRLSVTNGDFGTISLRFDKGAAGLTVSMTNADPDFAATARTALAERIVTAGETVRSDMGQSRGDNAGQSSQQSASHGQTQAQMQNNGQPGQTRLSATGPEPDQTYPKAQDGDDTRRSSAAKSADSGLYI